MKRYECGKTITSIDEFAKQRIVWVKPWNNVKNMGFLGSMQFRVIESFIKRGDFAVAIDKTVK